MYAPQQVANAEIQHAHMRHAQLLEHAESRYETCLGTVGGFCGSNFHRSGARPRRVSRRAPTPGEGTSIAPGPALRPPLRRWSSGRNLLVKGVGARSTPEDAEAATVAHIETFDVRRKSRMIATRMSELDAVTDKQAHAIDAHLVSTSASDQAVGSAHARRARARRCAGARARVVARYAR